MPAIDWPSHDADLSLLHDEAYFVGTFVVVVGPKGHRRVKHASTDYQSAKEVAQQCIPEEDAAVYLRKARGWLPRNYPKIVRRSAGKGE